MNEEPKRFSLSDYQSKRGPAKPAETAVPQEQRNELEELHMLLGTGAGSSELPGNDDITKGVLRTPGASPVPRDRGNGNTNSGNDGRDAKAGRSSRRSDKRSSKESRSKKHSSSRRHRHSHRRRSSRRSRSPRSKSRSRSRTKRTRARSASRSRSRSTSKSRSRSRSRSRDRSHRSGRSRRSDRRRSSRRRSRSRSRSRSQDGDKVSMRCVFPYEDGGIIIGLRGAHLSKLRRTVPAVDWRISNETNDRQDRILVVKGTVDDVAEAFKELSEHFISQGMHIDYPLQSRSRGGKEVDTDKPFVPIRLLIPHKTCGAIIGQKSETLINTRINCAARRVYVYRDRIADSRERIVEVVGTPRSIARVMRILGSQIGRTLSSDQRESDPYVPERDGLRNFLSKQGVPRSRVSLESVKSPSEKDAAGNPSDAKKSSASKKKRSRSQSISPSRSPSSERSRSCSRSRDEKHRSRSGRQRKRQTRSVSASQSRSPSKSKSRRQRGDRRRSQNMERPGKSGTDRHSNRKRSDSVSSSPNRGRSRSRSRSKGDRGNNGSGSRRDSKRGNTAAHRDVAQDEDADMYDSNEDDGDLIASDAHYSEDEDEALEVAADYQGNALESQDLEEDQENNAPISYHDNAGSAEHGSFQGGSW
ncbi:RNA binding protein, heterogenous nuclear RNP-K like protein [Coemansia sp. RSA 1813]|nr:RNA binding protein, heterogenous nuclear RNP-K like protein [Coemansia sp. RSA 1646]KAJ1766114.1 RNA binding protein, heterogenous nuclear RNP-K like protein [Coemansia sp. RSA 1843]KAJ2093029.1 RNA binding protein, heterogenous nuclear RNP-K like protein [Coemansia sp. RSA 986]KAJ2214063.1 RNA binding protein, heterogenous nuclear RNP-K like protein [Coemansia sp. RSA 487]KAJ2569137.1 RNA binding protein, heterogenous nuclear RNP-K like protein [Coemansia sp. RSA 1813]